MATNQTNSASPSLLLSIRALLPALNEQEQKVGQYILDHPAEVIRLPMSALAERASASDATVFRFCRKVGTGGYQDLKIRLAQEIVLDQPTTYGTVTTLDSPAQAVRKAIAADVKALEDTLRVLDMAALDQATDALLGARRVDIYGSGGAAVAALELQYKLMRVGVRAVAHTDADMQAISATLLTAEDVAVGISHSGRSPDVLHALEVARRSGARIVAITNHPLSPIAQTAHISLVTAAQEALAHGYPLGARVAQVALIDAIYTCMTLRREEVTRRNQERIAEALARR